LLIIFIVLAYIIFANPSVKNSLSAFKNLNYLGVFISGILMSWGFSAPFGFGVLVNLNPQNILLASLIGGAGGVIADLLIFRTMKWSFMNEFKQLEKTKAIKKIENVVKENKHVLIKHYSLYLFAGLAIATPLPDELGVSMLAGLTTIDQKKLAVISFLLHSIAIFVVLYFL
jgi:uncharacterized membrane protein YdjX (TVP38/TMEM64 family)